MQRIVERRFNRARYEMTSVLEGFTASVHRHVDVETLTDDLTPVVAETLQPSSVVLWLHGAPARSGHVGDQDRGFVPS